MRRSGCQLVFGHFPLRLDWYVEQMNTYPDAIMHASIPLSLTLLLVIATPLAGATRIFTWVDDAGVTHFSETPPPTDRIDSRSIDLEIPAPRGPYQAGDDFYSVINQAARMESRRLENEKLAAEKRQAIAEANKARAEAAAIQQGAFNDNNTRYYPVFSYYPRYGHHPWKPGHGHGHKPKPRHPIHPGHTRPKNPRTSLGKTPGMPRR